MAIITISRGSYSRGREVAEKVAERLGYECTSRDILLEASEQYNVPEVKLVRAIHDAPSFFERQTYAKERYIAYIRSALLTHVQRDDVVYHGLAGHFLLGGLDHLLRVRITADIHERVKWEVEREATTEEEAVAILTRDDEQRHRWSQCLYGIDTKDSSLYDLCLNVSRMPVDHAVQVICDTVALDSFRTTPESQQDLDNRVLAARVKGVLVDKRPDLEVWAHNGNVEIRAPISVFESAGRCDREIEELAYTVPGVEKVTVTPHPRFSY